jgi:hypothetical protein
LLLVVKLDEFDRLPLKTTALVELFDGQQGAVTTSNAQVGRRTGQPTQKTQAQGLLGAPCHTCGAKGNQRSHAPQHH